MYIIQYSTVDIRIHLLDVKHSKAGDSDDDVYEKLTGKSADGGMCFELNFRTIRSVFVCG